MDTCKNGRSARARGASMVEYAFLMVAMTVCAAGGLRTLGTRVMVKSLQVSAVLQSSGTDTREARLPSDPTRSTRP